MRVPDAETLVCPLTRAPLCFEGTTPGGHLGEGHLISRHGRTWPVLDGLPRLFVEEDVQGSDRLMRRIYDGLPFLHDAAVRTLVPLAQTFDGSEGSLRNAYMPRLELGSWRPEDGPLRILETTVGTGANLPLVLRDVRPDVEVELWGADLSYGMLQQCQKRLRQMGREDVRLVMSDAHRLPFPDASFDRVFHVGAINNFTDKGLALAEMARVAKPGTPVVVVDEQLDPSRRHSLWHKAWFKAVTFYDREPGSPTELLPEEIGRAHV